MDVYNVHGFIKLMFLFSGCIWQMNCCVCVFSGFRKEDDMEKCRVITNGVVFEVHVGHFNVHESFGDEAVIFDSSSTPVLTDDLGVTVNSLHNGVNYCVVAIFYYNLSFINLLLVKVYFWPIMFSNVVSLAPYLKNWQMQSPIFSSFFNISRFVQFWLS